MFLQKLIFFVLLHLAIGEEKCGSPCQMEMCSCEIPDVIDCSHQGLHQFTTPPEFKASGIGVLRLNHNNLNKIPDLSAFVDLHTLDLSYNKIAAIDPFSFTSLPRLQHLNISFNGIVLSNKTVSLDSFQGLTNLKTLRMKQNNPPTDDFEYAELEPLSESLEELYIVGTTQLSPHFRSFSKLHILSLGGAACYIPALTYVTMWPITGLPLKRFSAKNCGVEIINRQFLHSFRHTLVKLDLSCNHLMSYIEEITLGVAHSHAHTLLLDHINMKRGQHCTWNVTDHQLAPLRTAPIKILSLQANQIRADVSFDLEKNCPHLEYIDVSHNYLNKSAFQAKPVFGTLDVSSSTLSYNRNFHIPTLKYLGLQSLSESIPCADYNPNILNCNDDSDLFMEDSFSWNVNHNSDMVTIPVMNDIFSSSWERLNNMAVLSSTGILTDEEIEEELADVIHKQASRTNITEASVTDAAHFLLDLLKRQRGTFSTKKTIEFVSPMLTTINAGYNVISHGDRINYQSFCTNLWLYRNSIDQIDLSYTTLGHIPCSNIRGLEYLQKFVCVGCAITGWHSDLYRNFPIKHLELSENLLGSHLRHDVGGKLLASASGLKTLHLGEQYGGIYYFSDYRFLAYLPNLEFLDLHGNKLTEWNITISHNPQLNYLDLRDNQISHITEAYRKEFDTQFVHNGFTVKFSGNKVKCTASQSHLEYIYWLLSSPAVDCKSKLMCVEMNMTVSDYFSLFQVGFLSNTATGSSPSNSTREDNDLTTSPRTLPYLAFSISGATSLIGKSPEQVVTTERPMTKNNHGGVILSPPEEEGKLRGFNEFEMKYSIIDSSITTRSPSSMNYLNVQRNETHKPILAMKTTKLVLIIALPVAAVLLLVLVYCFRHEIVYRCCAIHHHYKKTTRRSSSLPHKQIDRDFVVFASHTKAITEKISYLIEEVDLADDDIRIISSEISTNSSYLLKASTAHLIAQSEKIVIFITPDYMKDDMTQFEFELIKLRPPKDILVVTIGIDANSQMEHLPKFLTDIIADKSHLPWPIGGRTQTDGSFKAFVRELVMDLSASQPIYELFNSLAKENTSFVPCQHMHD